APGEEGGRGGGAFERGVLGLAEHHDRGGDAAVDLGVRGRGEGPEVQSNKPQPVRPHPHRHTLSPPMPAGREGEKKLTLWQPAQGRPSAPRWTSGSPWQPSQAVGTLGNTVVGWQAWQRTFWCLPVRRKRPSTFGSLWSKSERPVGEWQRWQSLPSVPWCGSS